MIEETMASEGFSGTVFVIIRDTGEYEQRWREPIRYVLTEAEAKAACERAVLEGETIRRPPYPKTPSVFGWQMPDGTWCDEDANHLPEAKMTRMPDGDARHAEGERLRAEYSAACLAMGCVDPSGPDKHAEYDYQPLSPIITPPKTPPHANADPG